MQIIDDDGRPLDAAFDVELDGDELSIVLESRGGKIGTAGAKNIHYSRGLELILHRLRASSAAITDAVLDTRTTQQLPRSARRLAVDGATFPLDLAAESDVADLRLRIARAQGATARADASAKGFGNGTKRLRLYVRVPGVASASALKGMIAAPATRQNGTGAPAGSTEGDEAAPPTAIGSAARPRLETAEARQVERDAILRGRRGHHLFRRIVRALELLKEEEGTNNAEPSREPQLRIESLTAYFSILAAGESRLSASPPALDLAESVSGAILVAEAITVALRKLSAVQGPLRENADIEDLQELDSIFGELATREGRPLLAPPPATRGTPRTLTVQEIREFVEALQGQYERDDREPADEHKRGAFIQGWADATERSETYSRNALRVLTWQNLGYRLGRAFQLSRSDARSAYDLLAIESWPGVPPSAADSDDAVVDADAAQTSRAQVRSTPGLTEEAPPTRAPSRDEPNAPKFRARRRSDRATQDAQNGALGLAGEELVVVYERGRLCDAGRPDLAAKVQHVSVLHGDGAGYDILSYNADDSPRHIEVKTTKGPKASDFFVSANEVEFSRRFPESFYLYRVYDFDAVAAAGSFYILRGPLHGTVTLTPTQFRASAGQG